MDTVSMDFAGRRTDMNKDNVLVVIDMQNDFIDGALGSKAAQAIVPKVAEYIKNFDGYILTTQDTHYDESYLDTQEGKKLPIKHCLLGTRGHMINDEVMQAIESVRTYEVDYDKIYKYSFGDLELGNDAWLAEAKTIYVCGLCTDICVISNAMILKAAYPEARVVVLKDLCAGTTPGNHALALVAMEHCQIETARSEEV